MVKLSYCVLGMLACGCIGAWRHVSMVRKLNAVKSIQMATDNRESAPSSDDEAFSTVQALREERERQRLQLLATEVALIQAERRLTDSQFRNATSFPQSFDYGFVSRSSGSKRNSTIGIADSAVPANALVLAWENFQKEWQSLLEFFKQSENPLFAAAVTNSSDKHDRAYVASLLRQLKLSNEKIWEREKRRPAVNSPLIIKAPYLLLCTLLDVLFDGRPIERFYFLETVARMPYFSYITMLHTYETLGWWRRSTEAKRIHFAEEYNEYHHLLIWESLGGDQSWRVRFLAQHSAIVYFFALIIVWVLSPSLAYNFSELIEAHAVDTYAEFAESNKAILEELAPPTVAKEYYEAVDMYVFDEFQTPTRPKSSSQTSYTNSNTTVIPSQSYSWEIGRRRPIIRTLYDVVCAIRDDEAAHVETMRQCQDPTVRPRSINTERTLLVLSLAAVVGSSFLTEGVQQWWMQTMDSLSSSELSNTATSSLSTDEEVTTEIIEQAAQRMTLQNNEAVRLFTSFLSKLLSQLRP